MYWKNFFNFMLSDRPMSEQKIQVFDPPDNFFFEKENQLKNLRQKIYVKNFFTA